MFRQTDFNTGRWTESAVCSRPPLLRFKHSVEHAVAVSTELAAAAAWSTRFLPSRTCSYDCRPEHAVTAAWNKLLLLQPATLSYCSLDHKYCSQERAVTALQNIQLQKPGTRCYCTVEHTVNAAKDMVLLQIGTGCYCTVEYTVTAARNKLLLHCRTYSYCSQGHAVTEAGNKLLLHCRTYSYCSQGHAVTEAGNKLLLQPGTYSCCKLKQLLQPRICSYYGQEHAVTPNGNTQLLQSETKLQQHGTGCCSLEQTVAAVDDRLSFLPAQHRC